MPRGPQTPGELRALERLAARDLVAGTRRRPGQKEERYEHLLAGGEHDVADSGEPTLEERVARLEADVERLKKAVHAAGSAVKPGV